jgi:secreted trypsin-like serine protease
MKAFVLLACLAGALAFSVEDVDLEKFSVDPNIVPVYETWEWKEAFPNLAKLLNADSANVRRPARVWGDSRLANPGEIPYQVGVVVLLSSQAFCGGSIVSHYFILTAADCFPGDPNAIVEIGNVDRQGIPDFITVAEKILHHAFVDDTNNNIALLRLVRSIVFSANARAVVLPNRRQVSATFENQEARFSGWGATSLIGSSQNRFLRVGFARVISRTTCNIRLPVSTSETTLCIDGSNVNFCNGDFGGPVTIQDNSQVTTQIGIASFVSAITRCTGGGPGGFTRVSFFLDWIEFHSDVVIRD